MVLTTLVLAAALLPGQEPKAEAQKGWVIEVRGYTYHAQAKPKEQSAQPMSIDRVEGIYVNDLRAYLEGLKKEKR
jgi:hypothetical protein